MLQNTIKTVIRLAADQRGQDFLEYALIAGLVSTSAVAISPAVSATSVQFGAVADALAKAIALTANGVN